MVELMINIISYKEHFCIISVATTFAVPETWWPAA
jgi:hypothetical protein